MNDTFRKSTVTPQRPFRPLAEVLVALSFLTRLPLPFLRTTDRPPLIKAMRFFPLAGAAIGLWCGLVFLACQELDLPDLLSAVIALGITTLSTGALHEDGFADMMDGLGGHTTEERLRIMRDERIGAYGTIALILLYMARASLLENLGSYDISTVITILIGAAAFSRALMVDLLWATRPARRDGLSVMTGRPSRGDALIALCIGGAILLAGYSAVLDFRAAVVAMVASGLMLGVVRAVAMRKLGGQTGDVCGAAQVVCELVLLAAAAAMIG